MDDWGGLENRCGLRSTVGSNPTLPVDVALSEGVAFLMDVLIPFWLCHAETKLKRLYAA